MDEEGVDKSDSSSDSVVLGPPKNHPSWGGKKGGKNVAGNPTGDNVGIDVRSVDERSRDCHDGSNKKGGDRYRKFAYI